MTHDPYARPFTVRGWYHDYPVPEAYRYHLLESAQSAAAHLARTRPWISWEITGDER